MEAMAQMGAGEPGAAAALQGRHRGLGGDGGGVEHRMVELGRSNTSSSAMSRLGLRLTNRG